MVTNATDARRRVMPLVQRIMKISFCLMEVLNARIVIIPPLLDNVSRHQELGTELQTCGLRGVQVDLKPELIIRHKKIDDPAHTGKAFDFSDA